MDIQQIRELLRNSTLAPQADTILKQTRPAARLIRGASVVQHGASRLNNAPDLPADFQWPEHGRGPYRFLAQFNLAELPKGMPALPSAGLLSLFYQYDDNGECFWGDPGFVIARFFWPEQKLTNTKQPKEVDIGDPISVSFESNIDLPGDFAAATKSQAVSWPVGDECMCEFGNIREILQLHEEYQDDYLFGYPTNNTLAYDPTPGPEWQSLLTLRTDEDLEWYWHDGDRLVTFIETKKLAIGDFSTIHSDAG